MENQTVNKTEDSLYKVTLYNNQKVESGTIWLLFLFFGWSYGSMNKMGLQVLWYVTLGGLGFWALVRLFTLSSAIKNHNKEIADRVGLTHQEKMQVGLFS